MQCHVGLKVLSNFFLMNAAMSFSMLYFSSASDAVAIASCCMSSDMSAFLITALRRAIVECVRCEKRESCSGGVGRRAGKSRVGGGARGDAGGRRRAKRRGDAVSTENEADESTLSEGQRGVERSASGHDFQKE